MRVVQIRGCLPALLVLALGAAVVLAFVAAGVALALPLVALLAVVGVARALWRRLTGRSIGHGPGGIGYPGGPPGRPPPPGTIEVVDREPQGPVVDVGPAGPPEGRPDALERPPGGESPR